MKLGKHGARHILSTTFQYLQYAVSWFAGQRPAREDLAEGVICTITVDANYTEDYLLDRVRKQVKNGLHRMQKNNELHKRVRLPNDFDKMR